MKAEVGKAMKKEKATIKKVHKETTKANSSKTKVNNIEEV